MMPFLSSRLAEVENLIPGNLIPESLIPESLMPAVLRPSSLAHPLQLAQRYLPSSLPSSFRLHPSVPFIFDDWEKGYIFDWYRWYKSEHPNTVIRKLHLRKERERFRHEFIVIFMDNGDVHRIDRRPLSAASLDAIWAKGCEAHDTISQVDESELMSILSETDLEIKMEFYGEDKPDLYTVIAICVGIRKDPEATKYTLQHFNCYFVSRTIIVLMTRQHMLQHSTAFLKNASWDAKLTQDSIRTQVFKGNWARLDAVIWHTLSASLTHTLRPLMGRATGGHRAEPERITATVIQEAAGKKTDDLVIPIVQDSVSEWAIQATRANLWHDDLEDSLKHSDIKLRYETAVERVLTSAVIPDLIAHLPNEIVKKLEKRRPRSLLDKLVIPVMHQEIPVLAQSPIQLFDKMQTDELVDRIAAQTPSFIKHLPQTFDTFLEKLPIERSEDRRSDDMGHTAVEEIFRSTDFGTELVNGTGSYLKDALHKVPSILPEAIIRVAVRKQSQSRSVEALSTHEDLQNHILEMTRTHSELVSKVTPVTYRRDTVYNDLRRKTAQVWRAMGEYAVPSRGTKACEAPITG